MRKIKCVIMRGGTSKAVVLHDWDSARRSIERKEVILKIFGSPDVRQIDGLGGATLDQQVCGHRPSSQRTPMSIILLSGRDRQAYRG
jgi:2-methylaconitate cis-trans-isomerase PrpF